MVRNGKSGELGQRWKAIHFGQMKGRSNWISVDLETHYRMISENSMPHAADWSSRLTTLCSQ